MKDATAKRRKQYPNVTELLGHYRRTEFLLKELCNSETNTERFRMMADEMSSLLTTKFVGINDSHNSVETYCIVPVLTAGMGLLPKIQKELPKAKICVVGVSRNEETLEPSVYKNNVRGEPAGHAIILEPMVATGGSIVEAIRLAYEWEVSRVTVLSVLAAPEGLKAIHEAHPFAQVIVGGIAEGLDERGYIVGPALGDFGDRWAGLEL